MTDAAAGFSPPRRTRVARDVIVIAAIVVAAIVAHLLWAGRHMRAELSDNALAVRGDLLGPTLPLDQIDVAAVRVVDPHTQIATTVFGGGLAGYRSGWFRLADGSRAQAFVRDGQPAVLLPTYHGYSLLVSVADPDAFVAQLRKRHSQSRD
ncbi:MAG: PH domain-containing protein [Burkholderiales bacterium]|nr:PH domain-containing protein [Burkholderiales bacterium]